LQEASTNDQLISLKGGQKWEDVFTSDTDFNDVLLGVSEKIGGAIVPGGSEIFELSMQGYFIIDCLEAPDEMNSFGESLDPSLELGTNWCPGRPLLESGKFDFPADNIVGCAATGCDDV